MGVLLLQFFGKDNMIQPLLNSALL